MPAGRSHFHPLPRSLAALAVIVAALLIAAGCGGDNEPAVSTGTATEASGETTAAAPEPAVENTERGDATAKRPAGGEGTAPGGGGNGGDRSGPSGGPPSPAGPAEGCPEGLSAEQCEALAASAASSHEVGDGECYASLSAEQCEALGQAYEDSKGDSTVLEEDECYGSLTAQQCEELGKAAGAG